MSGGAQYMERALALARGAIGNTSPNPAVGAVLVKNGVIVGEGATLPPGQAHAEAVALQLAGDSARGSTLYVTLEPCCNFGRTPPCARAIIDAGIKEVHVAARDPNPKVNGKGISQLLGAGVAVSVEEDQYQTTDLYEAFAKHIVTGIPFVTAKFAMSLDGKIATHTGDSRWITVEPARARAHAIRAASDAVMIGVNTLIRDEPRLTARDGQGHPLPRQPLRIVVDTTARTPTAAGILREPGRTLVAVSQPYQDRGGSLEAAGARVLEVPREEGGRVDLGALLDLLGQMGIVSLLAEGGSTLLGSLFDRGLVDKVTAFIAPAIIGGVSAPPAVGGSGARTMADVLRLEQVTVEHLGNDLLVTGYPPIRSGTPAASVGKVWNRLQQGSSTPA